MDKQVLGGIISFVGLVVGTSSYFTSDQMVEFPLLALGTFLFVGGFALAIWSPLQQENAMGKIPEITLDKIEINSSEDFTNAARGLAESLAKNTRIKVKSITFTQAHITDGHGVILEIRMDTERSM